MPETFQLWVTFALDCPPPSTDPLIRGLDPAGHTPTQLSLPKFHFLAPALALYGLPLQRRLCSVVRRLTLPLLGAGRVLSQRRRGAPRVDESIVQGVSSCGAESAMQHCLCQVHFGTCDVCQPSQAEHRQNGAALGRVTSWSGSAGERWSVLAAWN